MAWQCRFFFFQAEDGIRDVAVTGVQTCALPLASHQHTANPAMRCSRLGLHSFLSCRGEPTATRGLPVGGKAKADRGHEQGSEGKKEDATLNANRARPGKVERN